MSNITLQGTGTSSDPYLISNIQELDAIRNYNNSSGKLYYKQISDIDAIETKNWNSGLGFVPIGDYNIPFSGNYDGNNKGIIGLHIDSIGLDATGLFGIIGDLSTNASNPVNIKNLYFKDCVIRGNTNVGILFGSNNHNNTVIRTFNIDNIYVEDCYIYGNTTVGGIFGLMSNRHNNYVSNCHVKGYIEGAAGIGGIGGQTGGFGTTANISTSSFHGLINCTGLSTTANIGGILGFCTTGQRTSGTSNFIGNVIITNNYSIFEIKGLKNNYNFGGIVGRIQYSNTNGSYSRYNLSMNYSVPKVDMYGDLIKPIVGFIGGSGISPTITRNNLYYNKDVFTEEVSLNSTTSKTTQEMMIQSTYTDFNFTTTWVMSSTYPVHIADTKKFTWDFNYNPYDPDNQYSKDLYMIINNYKIPLKEITEMYNEGYTLRVKNNGVEYSLIKDDNGPLCYLYNGTTYRFKADLIDTV